MSVNLSDCYGAQHFGPTGESADETRAALRDVSRFYAEAAQKDMGVLIFFSA